MNSSDLEVYLCPVNHTSVSSETRIRKKIPPSALLLTS